MSSAALPLKPIAEFKGLLKAADPIQCECQVAQPPDVGARGEVGPVTLLADSLGEQSATAFNRLLEESHRIVKAALVKGNEAKVVVSLRIPVEALRKKPKPSFGLAIIALLVVRLQELLGIWRDVGPPQGKAPTELIVAIPLALLLIARPDPLFNQLSNHFQFVTLSLDQVRR